MTKYRISTIFIVLLTFMIVIQTCTLPATAYQIYLEEGTELLYKNEHYNIESDGKKTLDRTKWSKITIDKISGSDDKNTLNVSWSKWDVENVSLSEIDNNPNLWQLGFAGYVSSIRSDNPMSKFQIVFNEMNADMSELSADVLLTKYIIFYTNELGYFNNAINQWSENNTVISNSLTPSIKTQMTRIFEANLDGYAKILLNSTHPDNADAFYEIDFDLKLYLVYGQESNVLLSYNINFIIAESIFGQNGKIQRKIIFWNIRRPTDLTKDYPLTEIFEDIEAYDIILLIGVMGISSSITIGYFKKKMKKHDDKADFGGDVSGI